jgi:hypothetical protein
MQAYAVRLLRLPRIEFSLRTGVASELRADILGHGGDNVTEERYASFAKLKQMLEALQKRPIVTGHIQSGVVRPREDVLKKQVRHSARPRRRTKEAQRSS